MATIEWIDVIYEKSDLSDKNSENVMVIQAYDPNGVLIFDKEIKASLEDAKQTVENLNKGMKNSELYDYR